MEETRIMEHSESENNSALLVKSSQNFKKKDKSKGIILKTSNI